MALQDALNRLNEPANSQINWTFGNLLRARAARADWLKCPLLRQLEAGANLNARNELCRRTRQSLTNAVDLQRKAESLLAPDSPQFDVNLDDFLAEMLGAIYLSMLGHTNIIVQAGSSSLSKTIRIFDVQSGNVERFCRALPQQTVIFDTEEVEGRNHRSCYRFGLENWTMRYRSLSPSKSKMIVEPLRSSSELYVAKGGSNGRLLKPENSVQLPVHIRPSS